jgi:putative colanic acid biosynthesis acetyltransferase WcaF
MSNTSSQHTPEHTTPSESAMAEAPPVRRSVWSLRQKVMRVIWGTAGRVAWVLIPPGRPALIRIFGGSAGKGCKLGRDVKIDIPWNVRLGDRVEIGERVILYGLGPITIGSGTVIDYMAHLCAGTHDMRDTMFPLQRPPITIGAECYIGIDTYIAPNITLGDRCRVDARASVYKTWPDGTHLAGNPAKPVEERAAP